MRISTYHKKRGDNVVFRRGLCEDVQSLSWHRIYISSLFTYELNRTVATAEYYSKSVDKPQNIVIGGIGATLMPHFIASHGKYTIIEGQIEKPNVLEVGSPCLVTMVPDYSILQYTEYKYEPSDAYFCRATLGCVRKCSFCAVPRLEPRFKHLNLISTQVKQIIRNHGEKQDLVILDNNVLAWSKFDSIIEDILSLGFYRGARRGRRKRIVDFNQGLDARLLTQHKAELLSKICLEPVRLAFDTVGVEKDYVEAIEILANQGFVNFTNYLLYNCEDSPDDFYYRMRVNLELSHRLKIRVTGFPMKFSPINSTVRRYVSPNWHWKYLRGIQCVLLATHGMVSPNPEFFDAAFGKDFEEFTKILSMPERYIIYRDRYRDEAEEWYAKFSKLSPDEKEELLDLLAQLVRTRNKGGLIKDNSKFSSLLDHYYPDGKVFVDGSIKKGNQ